MGHPIHNPASPFLSIKMFSMNSCVSKSKSADEDVPNLETSRSSRRPSGCSEGPCHLSTPGTGLSMRGEILRSEQVLLQRLVRLRQAGTASQPIHRLHSGGERLQVEGDGAVSGHSLPKETTGPTLQARRTSRPSLRTSSSGRNHTSTSPTSTSRLSSSRPSCSSSRGLAVSRASSYPASGTTSLLTSSKTTFASSGTWASV